MSLDQSSVLSGTVVSATGGTPLMLTSLGNSLTGNTLVVDSDDDVKTRREFVFSSRAAKVKSDAPNGYTQERSSLLVKSPLVLDNLSTTVNTAKIELSVDVETTDAEKSELLNLLIQATFGDEFLNFWHKLSVG